MSFRFGLSKKGKWLVAGTGGLGAAAAGAFALLYEEPELVSVETEQGAVEVAVQEQKTAGFYLSQDGRTYVIWEGTVIEELNNNTGFSNHQTNYDLNIYDFDLGIIFHGTENSGIEKTLFNELAVDGQLPEHIERIRNIGCSIAADYYRRAETPEYSDPPEDIIAFQSRHCTPEPGGG